MDPAWAPTGAEEALLIKGLSGGLRPAPVLLEEVLATHKHLPHACRQGQPAHKQERWRSGRAIAIGGAAAITTILPAGSFQAFKSAAGPADGRAGLLACWFKPDA